MAATADDLLDALKDVADAVRQNVQETYDVQVSIVTMAAQLAGYAGQQQRQQQQNSGSGGGGGGSGGGGGNSGSGQGSKNALQSIFDFGKNAYNIASSIQNDAGNVAGFGASFVGGFATVGYAAYKFADTLKTASDEAKQATDKLFQEMGRMAAVSPSLGRVAFERERNQIFRDRDVGEKVAGSARVLMNSEAKLNENTQNIDALWQNFKNLWQAGINTVVSTVGKQIDGAAEKINQGLEQLGLAESPYGLAEWLGDIEEMQKRKDEKFASVVEDLRQDNGGDF